MNEARGGGQTLIELLVLLLPVVLSFIFAKIFFIYIGWLGLLPGVILGLGSVALFFYILFKFSDAGNRRDRSIARK